MSRKSKARALLVSSTVGLMVGMCSTAKAQNLLVDPDFEVSDGGSNASAGDVAMSQSPSATAWAGYNDWTGFAYFDSSINHTPGGSQAAKTFSPNGGIYQIFSASAGETFTGSAWVIDSTTVNGGQDVMTGAAVDDVRLIFNNSADQTIATDVSTQYTATDPQNVWAQLMETAIAPPGTATVTFMIHFGFSGTGGGALYADDASLVVVGSAASGTWNGGGSSNNWSDANNWGGTAVAANDTLTFAGGSQLANNNDTAASTQYNGISFSSGAGAFVLGGNDVNLGGDIINQSTATQTINMNLALQQGTSLNAASGNISVGGAISGGFSITTPGSGTVTLSGANTYSGTTNVDAGALTIASGGSITSTNVNVSSGATLNANGAMAPTTFLTDSGNVNFGANPNTGILARTLGVVIINNGAVVKVSAPSASTNRNVLMLNALNFSGTTDAWQGLLDLTSNDLIVHNGDVSQITDQIASGFNGGAWNGTAGITSSTAGGTSNTALGVVLNQNGSGNPLVSIFDGQSVSASDVLVKYTYFGDANLDGVVNGSDYTLIDNGFNKSLTGWNNGDFNYDGIVNGDDYTLIDNAFNTQGHSLAGIAAQTIAGDAAQIAGSSSVPEPTSLGLLAVGIVGLTNRRRRTLHGQQANRIGLS